MFFELIISNWLSQGECANLAIPSEYLVIVMFRFKVNSRTEW